MANLRYQKNILSFSVVGTGVFQTLYTIMRNWAIANVGYSPVAFDSPNRLDIKKLTIISPTGGAYMIQTKGEDSGCIPNGTPTDIAGTSPLEIINTDPNQCINLYDNFYVKSGITLSFIIEI